MNAAPVNPTDVTWELDAVAFRVYFWSSTDGSSWQSDEWRLVDIPDLMALMDWANEHAEGRTFVVYAEVSNATGVGLIKLTGSDPLE